MYSQSVWFCITEISLVIESPLSSLLDTFKTYKSRLELPAQYIYLIDVVLFVQYTSM